MNSRRSLRILIALLLILGFFVLRLTPTFSTFNDTTDEPYHLGAGLCQLETGHLLRGFQHPPLARLIAALPVYLSGVHDSADQSLTQPQNDLSAFVVGHEALVHSRLSYWQVLTRARLALLIFPLAAIVYGFLIGRFLAGPWIGIAAAAWLSTDPTLLGHATWIATDVPAAAGFLAILYHGLRWIEAATWKRALLLGVVGGLALSCKFTVALALPAVLFGAVLREGPVKRTAQFAVAVGIALLVLWATYGFDIDAHGPMPALRAGLNELARHNREGHAAYLNGEISNRGFCVYFLEAFALKSPVSVIVGLCLCVRRGLGAIRGLASKAFVTEPSPLPYPRVQGEGGAVLFFAGASFVVVAMLSSINVGIRHLLPALAMLYPLLALALRRLPRTMVVLIVCSFFETGWVHPNYLSYFNLLAGGPSGGERYLLDSNLDWGQDQQRAADWLRQHAAGRAVSVHVSGNARLIETTDLPCEIQPPLIRPKDLILISKNVEHGLSGSYYTDAAGETQIAPPLRLPPRMKPIATIGTSIDVFEIR